MLVNSLRTQKETTQSLMVLGLGIRKILKLALRPSSLPSLDSCRNPLACLPYTHHHDPFLRTTGSKDWSYSLTMPPSVTASEDMNAEHRPARPMGVPRALTFSCPSALGSFTGWPSNSIPSSLALGLWNTVTQRPLEPVWEPTVITADKKYGRKLPFSQNNYEKYRNF